MKILIAIIMMFLIVSCSSTNDEDLEKRVDYLESKLLEMDKEIENLEKKDRSLFLLIQGR